MSLNLAAGRGVTQVVERCEQAKNSGTLDLSNCQLLYIADAVYMLLKGHEIDKVNIRNNMMKKFPRKFVEKFPNVTVLNMEANEIAEIPQECASWSSLKGVNASQNQFAAFPEPFFSLAQLKFICLSSNLIEEIDAEKLYTCLPELTHLDLSDNRLSEETKIELETHHKKPAGLTLKL
ncbi:unnamed protein product [Caenorhabditis bovis]|uniref:Leucine-rich repeat-containing protein 20 n=1 Tax=Caenorhabditis bovis TaxID=2654633 RepID=A0A8S1EYX6_9PELO|nr:unnamed protein product [Caenorhabditis bovis]